MSEPIYVEYDGRIFELVEVNGFPQSSDGRSCRVRVIPDEQRIEISDRVTAMECASALAAAMGFKPSDVTWRMVPCAVAPIRATAAGL